jgi:acetyl-CoA C-acetyltransferase
LEGLVDPVKKLNMAATAEILAQIHGITRQEQDAYAVESYRRAIEALDKKTLVDHVFPVTVGNETVIVEDENPRMREQFVKDPSKLEKMTLLFDTPAFTLEEFYKTYKDELEGKTYRPGVSQATITPFNACPRSDGAGAVIVTTETTAKKLGLKIEAELMGWDFAGVDPAQMGKSPAYSTDVVLKRLRLKLEQMGVIDLHEAFAAGCLAIFKIGLRDFKHPWQELLNARVVNPSGGSLALGHPLAASGTRVILNVLGSMSRNKSIKYGMAAACAAGGMGCSMVFRNYEG